MPNCQKAFLGYSAHVIYFHRTVAQHHDRDLIAVSLKCFAFFAIWDLSKADLSNISNEDIQRIAEFGFKYASTRREGKTAFVAPEDFGFGLSRVFAAISEMKPMPVEMGSFRNLNDEKKWLGIS